MKNYYIAVNIQKNGKMFAHVVKAEENANLLCKLAIDNIVSANICETKKAAAELCDFWNDCYKHNGTYLFDDAPLF